MFSQQANQSNEYLYSLIVLMILSSILLFCVIVAYVSYVRLQSKYLRIKQEFVEASLRKKEILELLNFQQISVTNIGSAIQSIITTEFEQQSASLFNSKEYSERRETKKHSWHKILELAERLAHFTLRNEKRHGRGFEINTEMVFSDNQQMLSAVLSARHQTLSVAQQGHCILSMPKGALDKILRGTVLQMSKVAQPNAELSLHCDSSQSSFNFSVTAWGVGIPRAEIQSIDISVRTNPRFHYAKRAQDNEGDLNLASIHRLVAQLGGTVKIVSALNYATIIYISLPRQANNAATFIHATLAAPATRLASSIDKQVIQEYVPGLESGSTLAKPKVLIVDQNDTGQMILHRALQNNYQCFACKSPLETMQLIHNIQPAVILIEHTLTEIEPLELIKLIRDNRATESTPIIVSCGIAARSFRLAVLKFGSTHIVEKPILHTELHLLVASLMEQQQLVAEQVGEKLSEYHRQQLAVREPKNDDSNKDKSFIVRFNDMMLENYKNDKFTREIAAKHMNVCLRTLNRRLNEHYSHNFKEHLRKYRLDNAKTLLSNGYTINEASLEVGFSSASYFSTCFKAEYGFAPSRLVSQSA